MGVVYSMIKLNIQKFASATFTGPEVTGNYSWAKIQGRVICEETYVGTSIENKSTIKCTVQARVTTGGTTAANWRIGVTCNGVTKTAKSPSNMTIDDSWVTINTLTFENVAHNEDGSKVVAISGYAQAPEYPTSLGNAKSTFSGNMTLTTIPRATTLDSFSGNKRIGVTNDVIINFTKKNSVFTTTIEYATKNDFSDAVTIVNKSANASTYSWTIPISLLNKIPNSKSLTIYIRLTTYDGNTQIGNAQTSSFTASVYEDNCRPVWNTHTIEETDTTAKQLVTTANKFIANLSKPKFTFDAKGQYGATISYYQVNNTTRSSGFTDSAFNTNGYTIKVVDSRGVTNTYTFTTTYVPYFTPVFEEVKLFRDVPTSNKVFSYFKIKFFNNTSEVKFDNPQALSYEFDYQENGATAQEILITPETYDIETSRYAENETELGSSFNYKKSVDWTFSFIDLTGKTFTTNATLPMGIPLMNGKMNADGEQELYVNGKLTVDSNVVSRNLFNINKINPTFNYETRLTRIENGIRATALGTGQYRYSAIELDKTLLGKTITLSVNIKTSSTNQGSLSIFFGTTSEPYLSSVCGLTESGIATFTIPSTFPSGCDKLFMNVYSNGGGTGVNGAYVDYTNIQIEEGSQVSEYTPYLNLEEAMNKEEIYSTSEQRIGTFLGKPLYRKVVKVTPTAQYSTGYTHGIDQPAIFVKVYGTFHRPGTDFRNNIPSTYTNWEVWLYDFRPVTFSMRFSDNVWGYGVEECYIVFEYTKYTD
jgi:hypothetical protein